MIDELDSYIELQFKFKRSFVRTNFMTLSSTFLGWKTNIVGRPKFEDLLLMSEL